MAEEHVITHKNKVIGTAKTKKEARALTRELRNRGHDVYFHKTSDYKKFLNPKYEASSPAAKTATALKTIKTTAKPANKNARSKAKAAKASTSAPVRGAKGFKYAGGTNATGGGP